MPQIANQDYNVIRPVYADVIEHDASALGMLSGHIKRGTIFDVLIEQSSYGIAKVITLKGDYGVIFITPEDNSIQEISIDWSPTQYEGLAAVQVACQIEDELPQLGMNASGVLLESNKETYLCVDGKLVNVTTNELSLVATLSVSNDVPGQDDSWVNVSFEELQKLVGVLISEI